MNLQPLIKHELTQALRRKWTGHRARTLWSMASAAAALWLLLVWSGGISSITAGRQYLRMLALLGYALSVLTGVLLTADTLSRERREGTLELLHLAGLNPREVVLGKLLGKLLLAGSGLLALAPLLMVCVMVGGTSGGDCARVVLAWFNGLFVTMSLSLAISALCTEQRTAYAAATTATVLLATLLPLAGDALAASTANSFWEVLSLAVTPTGPYRLALSTSVTFFWVAFLVNLVVAASTLSLGCLALLRPPDGSRNLICFNLDWPRRLWQRLRLAVVSRAATRAPERSCILDARPIEWLATRTSSGLGFLWTWPLLAAAAAFITVPDPFGGTRAKASFALWLVLQTAFKLAVGVYSAYALSTDRRTGALESLLGSSLEVREIASGLFRSFRGKVWRPLLIFTGMGSIAAGWLAWSGEERGALVLAVATAMLVIDTYGVFWVGLFDGLAGRTPGAGLLASTIKVLGLPVLWFLVASQVFWRSSTSELIILWAILACINHLVFIANATGRLYRYFRVLALKPVGEKAPATESSWSPINWDASA